MNIEKLLIRIAFKKRRPLFERIDALQAHYDELVDPNSRESRYLRFLVDYSLAAIRVEEGESWDFRMALTHCKAAFDCFESGRWEGDRIDEGIPPKLAYKLASLHTIANFSAVHHPRTDATESRRCALAFARRYLSPLQQTGLEVLLNNLDYFSPLRSFNGDYGEPFLRDRLFNGHDPLGILSGGSLEDTRKFDRYSFMFTLDEE